ncbi:HAD-IIA family hydrolase [Wohlfahrtiimonas chitiniclastica]|uniref:HAD-IIA family hydrolase n=1 Tax=Wohlfahrtiimonas chitiniclastica TaxID=400946 RepID=UPI00215779DC|nr:HAD hydrolase-like protein [Wohlfahrtiimonas chitiniclastica]MDC7252775.1 haloacid dehalogenase [Wohlfahrtiimonas chitiniclastica]
MSDFDRNWAIYLNHYRPDVLFPEMPQPVKAARPIASLLEIVDEFDVMLLDGFGVLNVGPNPIDGMPEVINALMASGKQAFVLTNGATFPVAINAARYPKWGYPIPLAQVISSRMAAEHAIAAHPLTALDQLWGVVGSPHYDASTIDARTVYLTEENIDKVDGILFLGTMEWSPEKQAWLVEHLKKRPRPILIGNPDVCAPLATGFTVEPGQYALDFKAIDGVDVQFFGKPFQLCYSLSYERIRDIAGNVPLDRILMVGDTLHTDILGGNTCGMKTALMADYGFLRGQDPYPYIEASGITPDFVVSRAHHK